MRRRLVLTYMSLTALLLIALEIPLWFTFTMNDFHHLANTRLREAARLAVQAVPVLTTGGQRGALERDMRAYQAQTGARIAVVDRTGRIISATGSVTITDPERLRRALQGDRSDFVDYPINVRALPLFLAEPVTAETGVLGAVVMISPTGDVRAGAVRTLLVLVAALLLGMAAAALLAAPFTRWVLRPVRSLDRAAKAIAGGDYEVRAPADDGPAELRSLAQAFNTMAGRLVTVLRAHQNFTADASHQLRNPLTALRLRLENLQETAPDPEVARAAAEAERFGGILDALLRLAQAEGRITRMVRVELRALAGERVAAWRPAALVRQVRVEVSGPEVAVSSAPDALGQVLDVLVDNAIEHAPPGSVVRVRTNGTAIHVADQGPGMSAEEKARAWERFWRGSTSADREGSGLGLAIAASLLDSIGGAAELRDAEPSGLEVVVRLPAWRD
ncbi:sensor histidine kinase [Nonomuraea sediminis]|uniref:sensor histidine kinase n=1 Tax=Nonomuraea sediminis TaxID=2835864 RepID=UPI001BDCD98C|nr:HAMP domain-containing sensor histidine kinase [Nonomuraea sediminis]